MPISRRTFIRTTAAAAVVAAPLADSRAAGPRAGKGVTNAELDRILDAPVLKLDFVKAPVTVASVELLRNGKTFLLRTRSTDGAEAITVPNSDRMANVYPLFLDQIVPVFLRQDARRL